MASFDPVAATYDENFSSTITGQLQRQRVYTYLEKYLSTNKIKNVLELNCGTGEDAIWLAQKGIPVLATDISSEMVKVTNQKAESQQLDHLIESQQLAIENLDQLKPKKLDLIFSNFGGLNCVSPQQLKELVPTLLELLQPNGIFIAVVMARFCWWETLYFSLKGNFKAARRRQEKGPILAPLDDRSFVETWYYSPQIFNQYFNPSFQFLAKAPIGFWLPPSYLDPFFRNKKIILNALNFLEKYMSGPSNWADHFLMVYRKGEA